VGARGSSRGRGPGGLQRPGVAHEQGMREGPVGWTPPRRERGVRGSRLENVGQSGRRKMGRAQRNSESFDLFK
jgi:hypothetical protein